MADAAHVPVLLTQAIAALVTDRNGIYFDATYGRGGHARAILAALSPQGKLIAVDRDPQAEADARRIDDARFVFRRGSFSRLAEIVAEMNVTGKVSGVLFDLGVSSPQLDDSARGFSFRHDGPLDMRMNNEAGQTAAEWLNVAREADIADVIWRFGEERFSRRIARAIVQARRERLLSRTHELAQIVAAAVPTRERHIDPATRTFQAVRIFINNELEELRRGLKAALDALTAGGRLAVISFHSLEDKIVKQFFRKEVSGDDYPLHLPIPAAALHPRLKIIGKAIRADERECAVNPRARSASLRVAERLPEASQ